MRHPPPVSTWFHLPVHSGWSNRYRFSQFISGRRTTRHLLRSCPLPLRTFNGGRIRYYGCFRTLIPTVHRVLHARHMNQNSLRGNVCGCQPNLLPTTLPGPCGNASTLLRLPRRLHPLKHCLFDWVANLTSSRNYVPVYYLGSICRQA